MSTNTGSASSLDPSAPASSSRTPVTTTSSTPRSSDYPAFFPALYSFPPFYTRQPNSSTWSAQLSHWRTFVLDYARHNRLWRLHILDALETPLFWNRDINRRLSLEVVNDILESLVQSGNAEWTTSEKSVATIYWRKPEEWASLIAGWIDDTGQKGQVLTLYEITEGETTRKQEFHTIDEKVLRKSLDVLVKKGTAQVFSIGVESGVKFF